MTRTWYCQDVGMTDVGRDICVLPDEFPVVVDEMAVEPMSVETGPQVGRDPDLYFRAECGGGYCGYQTGYPKFVGRVSGAS